jgi:hypothetical protein
MKNKLLFFLSSLALMFFFASCDKEYSYENGINTGTSSGTAVYDFVGAPGNCISPVINGNYTAGTATSSSNYVILQVTVTTPGTFEISTALINGITFSGSGTFVTTGLQAITLTAIGTPAFSGSFGYIPGLYGCSFIITVIPAEPVPETYFRCKINGVLTTFNFDAKAIESSAPAAPPIPATTALDISGSVSNTSYENMLVSLNKTETAIVTGDTFTPETLLNGRVYLVYYTDANGTTWNAFSSVSDTPFTITVTKRTATNVQGTFSGTVSDNAGTTGGNLKIITEGTFSVPIQ